MFNQKSCTLHNFGDDDDLENNNFVIRTVVLLSLVHLSSNNHLPSVFNIQKDHLHQNSNPRHFCRVVAFVPVISSLKQTMLVLFTFYQHEFP
jgi:hypothetical protein